ncbi:myb-binding protein 1A [Trichosurus vulpecula]|uniref:myb-binding protein 1A n=1 Tax=Trichosurus vulpecula TaxID=9337 RepID=UPI00186AD66E|nr:myb-binding protein 1A [Trichosurus vulpecula]
MAVTRSLRSTRRSRAAAAEAEAEPEPGEAAEATTEAAEATTEAAEEATEGTGEGTAEGTGEGTAEGTAAGTEERAPSSASASASVSASAAPAPLLQQSRDFLDLFWGIAKPAQDERLAATAALVERLRERPQEAELQYALKRLIEGLGATREAARPGFSLALSQVLQALEDVPLLGVLEQIREKHDLQRKKFLRNAAFGNFFGVLALFQSGRLVKDHKALVEAVRLLQSLAQHRNHLQDLPHRTLVDILSEVPEPVFEEALFSILQADFTSAFSSPEQLQLLLVGLQRFPGVLQPRKLKKLLGSASVVTKETVPRLVEVLSTAAKSVKKEKVLPPVGLDLIRVALQEGAFDLFWKDVVEAGLLEEPSGPSSYAAFRLLGSALPLLSLEQLHMVLHGEVMRRYGNHVLSAQLPSRFKFAPEMEKYVSTFMEGCEDPEKQLAVLVAFSSLTNQGYPVVPSLWPVVKHLQPEVLNRYSSWLQDMFLRPDLSSCLEFSTSRQKKHAAEDESRRVETTEKFVFRLRKWLIQRLTSIVENPHVTKDEAFVLGIARFCFFHSFFETKKPSKDIPESQQQVSVPLDSKSRDASGNAFFSLLQTLNSLPLLRDAPKTPPSLPRGKASHGVMADGQLWTQHLVQYADFLLSHSKNVRPVKPFSTEEKAAWDRMLQSADRLRQRVKDSRGAEITAFLQLLLLVGIHLFKAPGECVDLLSDLQNCIEKALDKKAAAGAQDPQWVEVMVEILLSLLSQPSRLMRQVSRSVFAHVCPHLNRRALQLILDVLDPEQEEDGAVVVTEEPGQRKRPAAAGEDESEEDSASDEDSSDNSEGSEDRDSDEASDGEVDSGFRQRLMTVLQAGKALEADGESSEEELDDDAMMALDARLASLFAEQKLRTQAKKQEKDKMQKEKNLRCDFKIKVLDLVEGFLIKQPENPLVLELVEPLLAVIERSMSRNSAKQEQDFLRKTADIFTNQLCRAKQYCHSVAGQAEDFHAMLERLVQRASHQADSTIALYHFSASLYLLRVLKGNAAEVPAALSPKKQRKISAPPQVEGSSCLDLARVTRLYTEALTSFLSKRNSPLTAAMFVDLFSRHPMICRQLLPVILPFITTGARPYHQAQACLMLLKALQMRELRQALEGPAWQELIGDSIRQTTESLRMVGMAVTKRTRLKMFKALELLIFLVKTVKEEKLPTSLEAPLAVLQTLRQSKHLGTTGRLSDLTWQALKLLGVQRPKEDKVRVSQNTAEAPEDLGRRKRKKGFLPETKKRKRRQEGSEETPATTAAATEGTGKRKRKRRRKSKQHQTLPGLNGTVEGPQSPSKTPAPDPSQTEVPRPQALVNGASRSAAAGSEGPRKKLRASKRKTGLDATSPATPMVKKARLPPTGENSSPKARLRKKVQPLGPEGSPK